MGLQDTTSKTSGYTIPKKNANSLSSSPHVKSQGYMIPKKNGSPTSSPSPVRTREFTIPKKNGSSSPSFNGQTTRSSPLKKYGAPRKYPVPKYYGGTRDRGSTGDRGSTNEYGSNKGYITTGDRGSTKKYDSHTDCDIIDRDDESVEQEDQLPLLIIMDNGYGGPPFLVVNHPILEDVRGHYHSRDFVKFFTNKMFLEVVRLMSEEEDGFEDPRSSRDLHNMNEDDFLYNKHLVLTEFFWSR